jgi:NADPH:quinone reductase-like Zn-dependent oxidoreductase
VLPIPAGVDPVEAAAFPEAWLTAWDALVLQMGLSAGETVLMHGGASGVGTAAIQLIREASGRMIVTTSTEAKIARCSQLGADLAINYKTEDFVACVQEFTAGEGVDVILDIVGADYLARNVSLLKLKGRLVLISTLGGSQAELDLRMLMGRRLQLIGSVLRSRSLEEKVEIKERFMARFWPLLEDGTIQPVIDSVYPIEQANEAHQRMAESKNIGKIILRVRP